MMKVAERNIPPQMRGGGAHHDEQDLQREVDDECSCVRRSLPKSEETSSRAHGRCSG